MTLKEFVEENDIEEELINIGIILLGIQRPSHNLIKQTLDSCLWPYENQKNIDLATISLYLDSREEIRKQLQILGGIKYLHHVKTCKPCLYKTYFRGFELPSNRSIETIEKINQKYEIQKTIFSILEKNQAQTFL